MSTLGYGLLFAAAVALPVLLNTAARPAARPPAPRPPRPAPPPARDDGTGITPPTPAQELASARRLAAAGRWAELLRAGMLTPLDTCPDPGNGDALAVLAGDPHALVGDRDGRVLLVENAPTGHGQRSVHAIPVPADTPSALSAAAWTYEVSPALYATLTRRT